ncbi:MAG: hypothetical protein IJD60_10400 [Clostridia bacterium]|nr:hypothetical protein [Clostridia bacterium]
MIRAEMQADRSIETKLTGTAQDLIIETGALLARAVDVLAPMAAMSHSCSVQEAERLILDDLRELAETRLQRAKREKEGGGTPPEQPQPPRRRRRIFGQTCCAAAVEQ